MKEWLDRRILSAISTLSIIIGCCQLGLSVLHSCHQWQLIAAYFVEAVVVDVMASQFIVFLESCVTCALVLVRVCSLQKYLLQQMLSLVNQMSWIQEEWEEVEVNLAILCC